MEDLQKPRLFGLRHSNRDFTLSESWGKNQFNSSFPAALVCYMGEKKVLPIYLRLGADLTIQHSQIETDGLLGLPHNSNNLFFSFEESFTPYSDLVIGHLPRADLVTRNSSTRNKDCLAALEIKLTALPDSTTFNSTDESLYGSEIVIRPDTIVYIALAVAQVFSTRKRDLKDIISPVSSRVAGWEDADNVRPHIERFSEALDVLLKGIVDAQVPLLLQPIWKTLGKKGILAENCYDVFVWSNCSLIRLFVDQARGQLGRFTRTERSLVWLIKMLDDFSIHGMINPNQIIDQLTYNTKNDKAFAVSGKITNPYMRSPELTKPRISKYATREIILGGGHHYLSPERRLDAIILNSPDLFEEEIHDDH